MLFPGFSENFHLSILGVTAGLTTAFGFAFAATFLPLRERAPLAWRLTLAIAASGPFITATALLGVWDEFYTPITVFDVTLSVIPLVVVIRMAWQGVARARIYLLSFTPVNIAVLITVARNIGWISSSPGIDHALQIGSALHLLTMTISLGSRINKAERERRRAEHNTLIAARSAERRATEIAEARTRDLRRAKEDLEDALETERRTSREQMQFIDTVSHEYRTPVAVLRSNLDLLQMAQKKQAPVPAPPLGRMDAAILRLTEIIDVSLRRDRLVGKTVEISPELIDLQQLIGDAILIARNAHPKRTIQVVTHPEDASFAVPVDAPIMKTALINVIENALKYSPADSTVEIDMSKIDDDTLSISIADKGIGVLEKDLPFVFDKYYRAANAVDKVGAGIGLYLVRSIVAAHGGDVSLISSTSGTTATITLPLSLQEDGAR